jgi:hypothetical protein
MSFRAKKLRVQLPCSADGSLIELGEEEPAAQGARQQAVVYHLGYTCYLSSPFDLCHCSQMPCDPSGPPPCIDSALESAPQMLMAEAAERLIEPDLLPLLKRQLEDRLAQMDLAVEVAKNRLRERLGDIATAEQALRDRQAQGQEPGE